MADDLHDRLRIYSRVGKIRYGTMASVMKYKGQSLCGKLGFPQLRQKHRAWGPISVRSMQ